MNSKILLVDDEKDISDLIEEALRQDNFVDIQKAYTGQGPRVLGRKGREEPPSPGGLTGPGKETKGMTPEGHQAGEQARYLSRVWEDSGPQWASWK